jgi:hypothetical protein
MRIEAHGVAIRVRNDKERQAKAGHEPEHIQRVAGASGDCDAGEEEERQDDNPDAEDSNRGQRAERTDDDPAREREAAHVRGEYATAEGTL